ncbi:hypothetical protein P280DRAFT_493488 [Massarina eburnea CBS 473.64]|uniref:PHD-type domain-containing protein n=1 Tax=Massarina eburnea CBS 473.64 TaxID=1395130 RepID=A0A6A6RL34_9PLEO|nr:hypothetical protein P280DRAFT_493488 [Massarina eburnea CBS 473.64]
MHITTPSPLPIRLLSHNIRYATTAPFVGEKPWADRKGLLLAELKYHTLGFRECFVCLQEVLVGQLGDVLAGLGEDWEALGVGRDDGGVKGEFSPILFRKGVWSVEKWKTGWDAASVRIVTVGTFVHNESKKKVVGMCTHFDDQGTVSRRESAKLILKVIADVTKPSNTSDPSPLPVFLAGDLNSEPNDTAFQILNAQNSTLQDVQELADYTLANPDTLTKYKTAAGIAEKVLKEVSGWCTEGANVVDICERGDKLLEEETGKVYKGKKIPKGIGHCTTVSPSSYITPYTPLRTDVEEAATTLKAGECVKIQLGAQIDGLPAIVCDSVLVGVAGEVSGREADLMLATHYANELLLRLMVPPGLVASGTEEEQKAAAGRKPYTQTQITQLLEKVTSAYDTNLVESTTIWQFEHNEIESKKKIILAPGDNVKGEGLPEVGEVWGVEMGVSLGSGKVKTVDGKRTTLHRRTAETYGLKRPTSRQLLSEVVKKFGTFPFSLRQLEDEKSAKVGVIECVRGNVLRQYEVVGDKNNDAVARLFTTVAITKNGITRLAQPPAVDISKYKTDKKITDEEILKILEQPIGKAASKPKNKKKKKKPAKKAAAAAAAGAEEEESSGEEDASVAIDMPSLRKQRKSRTGTPLDMPTDTPADTPAVTPPHSWKPLKEKVQSSLDAWVEPALQNPTPSFEEHGFARHGVLETMAPLGVPPTAKAKQKARGDPNVRRSILGKRGNVLAGDDEGTTPEVTPAPELARDDSERPEEEEEEEEDIVAPFPEQDEDEDDDYMPTKKKAKMSHGTKTPVRGRAVAPGKPPAQVRTPLKNGSVPAPAVAVAVAAAAVATPASVANSIGLGALDDAVQQRIRIAVLDAIARSEKNNDKNLGMALKQMLEQSRDDPKLSGSLDGVIHQRESAEDWSIFRRFIKSAKKQIKRSIKIKEAEEAAMSAKEAQAARASTSPPAAAVTTPLYDIASPPLDPEPVAAPTVETAQSVGLEPEDTSPPPELPVEPEVTALHPLTTAPAFPAAAAPTPPARKMGSKSPRKQQIPNGHPAPEAAEEAVHTPTPADKTPDIGNGSDSALSDVDDDLINRVEAPKPPRVNGTNAASAAKKAKSAAIARAAKKPSRAGSMKPFGKHKEKVPLTPEQLAQHAEIEKTRQHYYEKQQPIREQMRATAPTSDIRFDDEILETESLTESQIAVGPPVDSTRPRRAGRQPRTSLTIPTGSAKRPRDGSMFSSPFPDSATTSRPSTPAASAVHVTSKRLKLNNGKAHQAARTKKSPVKNRDGPIAGIPHTGGGGSRQSGPDDNDPSSPPSETDDLCSACKGAGEFVICDHCPRVFHFLCLDPPMLEAPTGSFSCFECSAKLKPAENADTYFAPLFKTLDSVNTRAFALPADVQNHFENVAARPDGSYLEETKKFALPDYTKVHDGDKPILCASCGLTSGGKRQMLKCDFCAAHWHLDCLDPPMANPPHINLDSAQRDAWRCPRHVEHDFRSGYVVQNDLNDAQDTVMVDAPFARLGRKMRKPKHPQVIQPTFSRGMRNNGLIDIINNEDDDTDGEGNYVFGTEEKDFNSHVYRVPEKGLVLDFIDKIKSGRVTKRARQAEASSKAAAQRKDSMQFFAARSIEQQQAALNLAKLAQKEEDAGLNEMSVDALVLSLTAEAPKEVISAISDAPPPPVSDGERAQLLKLQELIKMRLTGCVT